MKPHVHVACALIEYAGRVLAAQRSPTMSLPSKWEFPGGKIEPGETPEMCLARELREELAMQVHIGSALPQTTHCYDTFTVTLYPFLCSSTSTQLTLHEHSDVVWIEPERLFELDWAAADLPVLAAYLSHKAPTP